MSTLKPQFWNKMAVGYAARPVGDQVSYEYKLQQIGQRLAPGMQVLEMGCGTGSTSITLAQQFPEVTFVAEDFAQEMINIANDKVAKLGLTNLTFNCSCADEGLKKGLKEDVQYDMVIAMNLVHLVPDWQALILQVVKRLKPNGWWVSGQFCLGEMPFILRPIIKLVLKLGQMLGKIPEPIHFLKVPSYRNAIQSAGLEIKLDWHPEKNAKVPFIMAQKVC